MAVLKATRGPTTDSELVCELRSTSLLVGRNPQQCDLVLEHHGVSREHARLRLIDNLWHIEDLNSRNGVLVNGHLIEAGAVGQRPLYPGDRIEIAAFELVFNDDPSQSDAILVTEDAESILSTIDCTADSSRDVWSRSSDGRLQALVGIIEDLSGELDLDNVLRRVVTSLFRVFRQAQSGSVLLPDEHGEFVAAAVQNADNEPGPVRISRTILNEAIRKHRAVLFGDISDDARFAESQSVAELRLHSVMCAPLLDRDNRVLGLIQLEVVDATHCFSNEDLELLVAIARHLSIVMENARLHDRQLREQRVAFETRFQTLVENSLQGILIHRDFKPLFVNQAWASLHGYSVAEVMQMDSVLPLLAPEERDQAVANAAARLRGATTRTTYEAQHLRKDQSPIWLEKFTSVIDWDGQPAVQTAVIDRTQRKRAADELRSAHDDLELRIQERTQELEDANLQLRESESELERSNRDLEQFAYSVSHDLQAPLRTITSYCQLLKNRYRGKLDDDADDFLNNAVEGSRRMKRLLDDLLRYSRVSTGGHPLKPTDLSVVVREVLENLEIQLRESCAQVHAEELPTVIGDETQLMQLLQNLIGNAIDYRSEAPPEIYVGVEEADNEWIFSVKDNGVGIEPRYFERVFMIFQRLYAEHERPGSGVGLSLCKRIVERHGGRIWVESEEGHGCVFRFTIAKPPAAEAQAAEPVEASAAP